MLDFSGTSGPPKGVMLSHKNFGTMMNIVYSHFEAQFSKMNPRWDATKESVCLLLPFYHIFGIGVLMNTIRTGSCGVVMRQFNPEIFCQTLQNYRMSHVYLVPPLLLFLAKSPIVETYDFSQLQLILTGAAQVGKEVADEVKRRIPSVGQVAQGYGMTEVSMASHFPVFDEPNHASVGKLMPNFQMKITDVESGRSLPLKEVGEVRVRGPTVMMGYYNRPEATDQTVDEDGWLRTGDIGYTDEDGHLYIVDRMKELIKVKGLQVSPCELENLLLSHPSVRDCAVIGIPDERTGELPKAFVVRSNERLTDQEVIAFIKERVSPHKQLAGGVEFVNEIPKSAAGKILRRILRDRMNQN
ncbi:Protein ACS-14 [Aphelenchoides avenae]|nr:Protein ACS-14 [Aphelenchus avenae]